MQLSLIIPLVSASHTGGRGGGGQRILKVEVHRETGIESSSAHLLNDLKDRGSESKQNKVLEQ